MKNTIEKTQNGVLAQSINAEKGATEHEITIGIKHMTAAVLLLIRNAAILAMGTFQTAKDLLRTRRSALQDAILAAREYAMLARDILKPILGSEYNERWDVTGYIGSLATPETADELMLLLLSLKNFFTANAALEVASRDITATQAQALYDALSAANAAVNSQDAVTTTAKNDRDAKLDAVSKSLRDLINELSALIDPLDPRWKAFGFNMPGAQETPDAVESVTATLIGPTAAALKWPAAARAAYYHVWKRVQGVDEDYVLAGSPADIDFTLENLPTNAHVDIAVSAVNDGGEGQRSASVTVITHA